MRLQEVDLRDQVMALVLASCSELFQPIGVDALDPLANGASRSPGKGAWSLSEHVSTHGCAVDTGVDKNGSACTEYRVKCIPDGGINNRGEIKGDGDRSGLDQEWGEGSR